MTAGRCRRRRFAAVAIACLSLLPIVALGQYDGVPYVREGHPAVQAKLEAWQDLKLGFLVHWGTYSQKGWCESWGLCSEDVDWLTPPEPSYQAYHDAYVGLKNTFDPVDFDPAAWARLARDAGMRYFVFTTKHHDGFCMFDTRQTDYKITDPGCPFHDDPRADVTRELFAAFRAEGLRVGAYFSKPDWHVPWYWSPHWQHGTRNVNYRPRAHPEIWRKFVDFTHAQVEELCTGYGPLDILWLDGAWVAPDNRDQDLEMDRLAAMARRHQPGLLIVDRWAGGRYENYRTPEQKVPDEPWDHPWETCMPLAGAWSYNADDVYKPTRQLVHLLVDVVAKGGNLLLNAGADGRGTFHPDAVARLRELGEWLQVNGDAIYATRPIAPFKQGKICFTRRRADSVVHAIYLPEADEPLPAELVIGGLKPRPGEQVRLLGHAEPLDWEPVAGGARIRVPAAVVAAPPCRHAWAFRLGRVDQDNEERRVADLAGWRIRVPPDAPPAVAYAARELRALLDEAGVEVAIAAASEDTGGARTVNLAVDPSLPAEGLVLRLEADRLRVEGGSPRGVLYGVYEFAERYLGVRFLTAGHTHVPDGAAARPLPRETFAYTPPFSFRWPYLGETGLFPAFAARLRCNTVTEADSLGGVTPQRLISHTLGEQLPVATYGAGHPEYYAFVRGSRLVEAFGGGPQPCLTNPAVRSIVTAAVLAEIAEHPERDNVSVSQTDNDLYCRCPACEAIHQAEGSPMGSTLAFVNAIADTVARRWPGKQVGTLAYWHTRKPPATLRPAGNVQIQLANIECCCLHALTDPSCAKNAEFLADLRGWSAIAGQVYVWTYVTDFRYYDLPFPNFRSLGPNLRLFADLGVRGVFAQSHGGSTSGDLSDLRNYVLARLLWNPYLDAQPLIEEFCRLHYGLAASEILAYLERLHDRAESLGIHPTCFATPEELGLDADFAREAMERFARAQAIAAAESPAFAVRVERASLTAHRALLEAGAPLAYAVGQVKRSYPHPYETIVDDYLRLAATHGLAMPDERTTLAALAERLRAERPAVLLENDVWRGVVLPGENGRVVELVHKPTGRSFLRAYRNNLRFGTWEDWDASTVDENAPVRPYAAACAPGEVVLIRRGEDGVDHTRRLGLEGGVIRCVSTLANRSAEPRTRRLVVHPEWDAGTDSADHRDLGAYVDVDGRWLAFNRDLHQDRGPDVGRLEEGLEGGAIGFYNHRERYGLVMRFEPQDLAKLRTWWAPHYRQINLELETPLLTLQPGEVAEIRYTVEYWPSTDPPAGQ
ncbi:MAG TPA: DUF4838 domain-containing protein [Candidatus Krumholzibacteria bacterium]|nr:DUF4838 domain-containing protein [Candidatus Krumholzibacteria bacterium]HPD70462.1 DUF4838 domain-containing protein [Candidatus Krumholzibacteria bacterium]HRY39838.1 DUF4838 domain-containing protein [Candidatus Krumholzibacteria bacterium]